VVEVEVVAGLAGAVDAGGGEELAVAVDVVLAPGEAPKPVVVVKARRVLPSRSRRVKVSLQGKLEASTAQMRSSSAV